jgi:membrane-associated protease RseP (regulator of RpoE activity)
MGMKYILRPYIAIALAVVLSAAAGGRAQSSRVSQLLEKFDPLLTHSPQGYLGVLVSDVDNDSATKLKLKEVRGALITLIDHDAPAGQVGLRVNDVVLEVNGQRVEGAEQFGRMMREIPAGRKVNLLISRDGNTQNLEVQLCDRKVMEQDVWNKFNHPADSGGPAPTKSLFTGSGDVGGSHFPFPFSGSSLNVGAAVEPLQPQTAEVLGIQNGILVRQVARKSEAAAAGFKPKDVILKVGTEIIKTTADWDRALRSNQNSPVQVTILRDGKQQVLNLQVDSKHNKSEVDYREIYPGLLPDGPASLLSDYAAWSGEQCPLMAALDPQWAAEAQADAEQFRQQADEFAKNFKPEDFQIDPKEMEKLRQDMEQFRLDFNPDVFKIDPKEFEQFQQQMEQFRKDFNSDVFRIDPKQMEDLQKQMEEFRKTMPELFKFNKQQLDRLRREMQQLRSQISQQV